MQLIDFKEEKQREILKLIGEKFIEIAEDSSAEEVELMLSTLQQSYFEPLAEAEFFGTEGWEYWLGLE